MGRGIARALLQAKVSLSLVEYKGCAGLPETVHFIAADDKVQVSKAVKAADYVVTATGIENVIQDQYSIDDFIHSKAQLVNMGAEDEYGPECPEVCVLNNKQPLNFILQDPTQMHFIDPVFALYNECASLLIAQHFSEGVQTPPEQLVVSIAEHFCRSQGYQLSDL